MVRRVLVSLGAVASLSAAAGAAPLILPADIPNGDFQSGDLTSWVVGAGGAAPGAVTVVADAGPGGIGDFAVHTRNVADWSAAFYLDGVWGEVAALEGAVNTTYNITFDVRSGNPSAGSTVNLRIEKGHWAGTQDLVIAQNDPLVSDGLWHRITIPYTTGASFPDNRFGIRVMGWSGSADHDFYFDNFAVTAVPEPAALGLVGMAVAGLLHRCRRGA